MSDDVDRIEKKMVRQNFAIRLSPISGQGVFASRLIRKGENVAVLHGETCTLEEMLHRVSAGSEASSDSLQIDDETYLDLDETSRTFNHSCDPNTYISGSSTLISLRDIQPGEEITYDYSTTMDDNEEKIRQLAGRPAWSSPCRCGAQHCRGVIDQFKRLPKEIRQTYLRVKHLPDFMLRKFTSPS